MADHVEQAHASRERCDRCGLADQTIHRFEGNGKRVQFCDRCLDQFVEDYK